MAQQIDMWTKANTTLSDIAAVRFLTDANFSL
jgi:hypothetical protein